MKEITLEGDVRPTAALYVQLGVHKSLVTRQIYADECAGNFAPRHDYSCTTTSGQEEAGVIPASPNKGGDWPRFHSQERVPSPF